MEKQKTKILIIDDDPDFTDAITITLESARYDVETASNADEGKAKIFQTKPDLIILDIMMDSLFEGFSLCHSIKTSEEYKKFKNTPIILVSAVKEKVGSGFQFKSEDYGFAKPDDYLDKPIKPVELIARIERLLKK